MAANKKPEQGAPSPGEDLREALGGSEAMAEYVCLLRELAEPGPDGSPYRTIDEAEALKRLAMYRHVKPLVDILFDHYPYLEADRLRRINSKILSKAPPPGRRPDMEAIYERTRAAYSPGMDRAARQDLICNSITEVVKADSDDKMHKKVFVTTPVQVVDFTVRSVWEALGREHGVDPADDRAYHLDPFAGTGIFPARTIEIGLLDKNLPGKYDRGLICHELDITLWHVAKLNIEEAFWFRTGGKLGYKPYCGCLLTDTFAMEEVKSMPEASPSSLAAA
jgi:predicted helicase